MKNTPSNPFSGSITALITPFKNGAIDETAYERLIERQISAGTHGLVPVGTTGESATLSMEEHILVVKRCVQAAKGRVPVIAGVGSNATHEALSLLEATQDAGADAVLAVTGYYNRPSQEGMLAHYRAMEAASSVPIILYNVPARTACSLSVETVAELSHLKNIVGIKDATGDLGRVARQRIASQEDFIQLSGEDITAVGFNAMGGVGCISVSSNIVPEINAQLQEACLKGDWAKAQHLQDQMVALNDALFADSSPAPSKYALAKLGLCDEEVRLPLTPAHAQARRKVDAALKGLELI